MKLRTGFVSNSSSSSYLCIGVEDTKLINKLLEAEKPTQIDEDGYSYYEGEGYGSLAGKHVVFYGNSESWQAAGLDESETKQILENNTLKQARKMFVKLIKERLGIDIPEKLVDLFYGESSSE